MGKNMNTSSLSMSAPRFLYFQLNIPCLHILLIFIDLVNLPGQ